MTNFTLQNRRRVLLGLAGALGITISPGGVLAHSEKGKTGLREFLESDSVLYDVESAAEIGKLYISTAPNENFLEELLKSLEKAKQGITRSEMQDLHEIHSAISLCVSIDFASGKTVNISGWVLSLTEARLCGLAATQSFDRFLDNRDS